MLKRTNASARIEKYKSKLILIIELIDLMAGNDQRTWRQDNRDYIS